MGKYAKDEFCSKKVEAMSFGVPISVIPVPPVTRVAVELVQPGDNENHEPVMFAQACVISEPVVVDGAVKVDEAVVAKKSNLFC